MRICTLALLFTLSLLSACAPKVSLFSGPQPLQEVQLQGKGEYKILMVNVQGTIDNSPERGLFSSKAGLVQHVVAQLKHAEQDKSIKALLLVVNSPGGGVTASDILYHEIMEYKKRTNTMLAVLMMDIATSGGYYISAGADHITAHPSTITGSIGTIFIRPDIAELMEKIGVSARVSKSGALKDMGSPFKKETQKETALFQEMIDSMNARFQQLVVENRKLSAEQATRISDARILTAMQAKETGLVDSIGYFEDAIAAIEKSIGAEDARVITYRQRLTPNDTLYNTMDASSPAKATLLDTGIGNMVSVPQTGFYYMWAPQYHMQ